LLTFHTESPFHFPGNWQDISSQLQNNTFHQNYRPAVSARSSQSLASNYRSSGNSIFSQLQLRNSVASTNTTWSNFSESSAKPRCGSQAELASSAHISVSYPQKVGAASKPGPEPKRASQRLPTQEKEPFLTCVSRAKRPRRSTKEPKYWCTSCSEGFGEKYDWKRHEETFQERSDIYECSLCDKYYYLDKDFILHHQKGHRCRTCVANEHVVKAKRSRVQRTGWGCGFCLRFDSDWTERCKHIAWHFEKGDILANWKHAKVILSLLQQPYVRTAWRNLIEEKRELFPNFGWNQTDTGRAEGYPDSSRRPQLQDLLEYFTPDQNVSALVQLAYEKGHRRQHKSLHSPELINWVPEAPVQRVSLPRSQFSQITNSLQCAEGSSRYTATNTGSLHRREKDLPPLPPKDELTIQSSQLQYNDINFESWNHLTSTIREDNLLCDPVPMDFGDDFDLGFNTGFHNM
jgi:hypothetical protein